MVGQKRLQEEFTQLIIDNKLPRFIILAGPKGSQKQAMSEYIADKLNSHKVIIEDISVDNIRNIINMAYTVRETSTYIILNADKMSLAAKNALLKVTEEPPNKVYFIMTLENAYTTLNTIRSRGTVYQMDTFKPEELKQYYISKYDKKIDNADYSKVLKIAETPYEIDLLEKYDVYEFISYVNKVIDNIATVNGANVFKIAEKINLKDDDTKYNLKLFFKAFINLCAENLLQDIPYYSAGIKVTSDILSQVDITGINKSMLFDKWILDIRSEWME